MLAEEYFRVRKENDLDISECLKHIQVMHLILIRFETEVREHREKLILQNERKALDSLTDLCERVQQLNAAVADEVFSPPHAT